MISSIFTKQKYYLGAFLLFTFLSFGCSSLHDAAQEGDLRGVKEALSRDGDINKWDISRSTPLHLAAENGHMQVVTYLVDRGARVNARNSFKETPLHTAAAKGKWKVVQYLLSHGAVIQYRNHHGNTALALAAQNGHPKVVEILLAKGGQPHHLNNYRESPYILAEKNGHHEVIKAFQAAKKATLNERDSRTTQVRKRPESLEDQRPPYIFITSPQIARGIRLTKTGPGLVVSGWIKDKSKIQQASINKRPVAIDSSGKFETRFQLPTGQHSIQVVAIDIWGNRAEKTFLVNVTSPPASQTVQNLPEDNYYALIIGNNDYQFLPDLQTAINDAQAVEKILRSQYGFQTTLLLNAKKIKMLRAFNRLRRKLRKEDHLLIYYAGHGYFDKEVDKAYWLPVDAEKDDDTNWIISDSITTNLQRITSKHILVVADSCYSGTLTRDANIQLSSSQERSGFLEKMMQRPSRTLMASGGNEPVTDGGGEGNHSVFATAFLNALRNNPLTVFTAEEIFFKSIKEKVAGKSAQVPVYNIIRNSGHDGGDFVFRKGTP